jgi:putative SOS response-associated peptidase YedK
LLELMILFVMAALRAGISRVEIAPVTGAAKAQLWLTASAATAKKLLVPYASGLTLTPVSERVNSVSNDDAGLLQS